ncbi:MULTISPECIES: CopD family protein [unclassified Arsukibacterium]|uniref:CopD family protein n=1 Tax=unclassified Arsukibacterium TaxID=2635278 RepID=UPI000C661ADD|nr:MULTISPECIES: CopD family protein [unclassified Arsukibacterium]MAA95833.1 TIGR00701 family protein [Rheinheimera sp.]MBM33575.1 TIGR00701 family protein [Rheinheimera sp.]HAW92846.1 TIGR00701 family protein [Candidatus Azambacteria bacterium]|tara:strand:- start:218647 stop:219084 length:438 start_codon:yes stop_codon:yes gene_type:complete
MTLILLYKALHLFFMVAWFAGVFYLPRLFVYHAQTDSTECSDTFKTMERRLLLFVTPFAVLTLVFGLLLIAAYGKAWFAASGWLHLKLVLVLLLYGYHGWCFKLLADFKHNRNRHSPRFYRVFNELPVLLLLAIILLATLKPLLY